MNKKALLHNSQGSMNLNWCLPTKRLFIPLVAMAIVAGTPVSAQEATAPTEAKTGKTDAPAVPAPFKLESVPKHILKKDGPYLAMVGYVRKGRKGTTGIFSRPGAKPLRFKMRIDENKVEKMTVDLDGDGKFDGEPEFNAPTHADGNTQTVTKNGKKIQIHVVKAGINGIALKNAQWYHGQVLVDGKIHEVAVIDLDFNGLTFDGTDAYVLDANGDGKFVPWIADREAPLKKTMLIGNTVCTAAYDAKSGTLSIGEMNELAKIAIKHPFDGKDVTLKARVVMEGRYVPVKVDGNTLELPPVKHDRVTVQLSVQDGKKKPSVVTYYLENLDAEKKKNATVTLPKPIAVNPRITQSNGRISVKEELAFKKADKTVKMASRFYAEGLSAGAPKVALYKGQKLLATGAMEYG